MTLAWGGKGWTEESLAASSWWVGILSSESPLSRGWSLFVGVSGNKWVTVVGNFVGRMSGVLRMVRLA